MDKKHSKNAPGLKYIIILFLMLGLSIFIYIYWYSIVSKSSKNHLIKFRQDFTNQEIEIKWNQILTTGFPYRIEHDLNNMEVKFKNVFFKTKSLKLINQPWNLRHFIIKIENDIIINNNIKNIKITNNNLISSLIFENNLNKRISIQSDMLRIFFDKFSLEFNKPELYSRKSDVNNNEIYFYANKLIYRKANNLELKNINIHTYLLNVTKFNVKNTKDWLTNEGGIEINNFSLLIDNNPIKVNGFISLDKNLNIISTLSIQGKGIENILKILKENDMINNEIYQASKLIIKTINISAKLINKEPTYSVNIQDGNLNLMNVKLMELPNLDNYLIN